MVDFKSELVELVKKRNEIEGRINQVSHAMEAMARTLEDKQQQAAYIDDIRATMARIGFQDAIRAVLAFPRAAMTAMQIRDTIQTNRLMDLSVYSNPLASIYTTLRRMKNNEEVEEVEKGGEKAYRMKQRKSLLDSMDEKRRKKLFYGR